VSVTFPALAAAAVASAGLVWATSRRPWATDPTQLDPSGQPMPRTGGIAVLLVWLAACIAVDGVDTGPNAVLVTPVLLLGLHDDLTDSSPRIRTAVLAVLALAAAWWFGGIESVGLPGGVVVPMGPLAIPLGGAVILAVTVGFDFIDGLDGLAAGLAAMAALLLGLVSGDGGAVLLSVALLGFLVWNTPPAKVYLGDAGSNIAGFLVGTYLVRHARFEDGAFALLPALLLVAIPAFDTALALGRRARSGAGLFAGDSDHLHHRLARRHGVKRASSELLGVGAIAAVVAALLIEG
jgi:UDP-GlcNAc:undecaprenyl-phosphate/decaprenyl-phosphate GlcNAc-1-phosphate transferase